VQIGKALQKARLAAGLSLRELEKRSGMAASQISQIETGRRADPGFSTVLRLAKALEASLDALAGLKEPRAYRPQISRPAKAALKRAQRQLEDAGQRIAEVLESDS
jgi:transcriptional regulator with XRE-family HTH domain